MIIGNYFIILQAESKKLMIKTRIMGCLLMTAAVSGVWAQGGTKSPYSQFGLGLLGDQSQSASRGMNGVGYALRQGNQVNTLNPASYASVDSLTMLFDMGLSGQLTHFEEGNVKRNATMANIEYVVGSFRVWKGVGMSFGVLPFTSVGYDYQTTTQNLNTGKLTESYLGKGGLHQLMLGVGAQLLPSLSVGANMSYLWGSIDRSVSPVSSSASNTLTKNYSTSISSYKLDLGLQWQQWIGKTDRLTLGAVVGVGHNLKNDADMTIVSKNSVSNLSDTTSFCVNDAMELPMSYGVGVAYEHARKLTLAADFSLDKWGSTKFPGYVNGRYELQSGSMKDRKKVNLGVDWLPNPVLQGSRYLQRVHYRLGVGYATPYYNIGGKEGPKELSVSAGVALPIMNLHNTRSVLNISGQWVHSAADGFITENTFRINIGITFNERWFMKWMVD